MGLSASQGRLLLLTARRSDLEFRAQQISQKRLNLSQQLEAISLEYENATSDRQMSITLFLNGQADSNGSNVRTTNLTYANLVSGTVNSTISTSLSGIQASDEAGTSSRSQLYQSNAFYRLKSASGAIVVSDESEIPGSIKKTTYTTTPAKGTEGASKFIYEPQKNGSLDANKGIYVVAGPEKNSEDKETDLRKILKDVENTSVEIDTEHGYIKIQDKKEDGTDANTYSYYNLADGSKMNEAPADWKSDGSTATLVKDASSVPQSEASTSAETELSEPGTDGVRELRDKKTQRIIGYYVVDEALKSYDDGPNYLQDCLRNGKYLVEKCDPNQNVDEGYKWSSISWDATANISDAYYTDNDDAAKAKYDRLQNQIQAQDKKLELELDNIETQRNAVTTEIDSVEKVISEDIEKTFNAFG